MTDEQYLGEALARLLIKSKWRFEAGRQLREIDDFYKEIDGGANAGQYDKACCELGGLLVQFYKNPALTLTGSKTTSHAIYGHIVSLFWNPCGIPKAFFENDQKLQFP